MSALSVKFLTDINSEEPGYWISFLGHSGVGKTFLSKLILKAWFQTREWFTHPVYGIAQQRYSYFADWRKWADKFRNQDESGLERMETCDLLVIDDIGAEYDPSGYALSKLDKLLNQRLGKWTIITSNMPMAQIGEKVDVRVVSRMLRGKSKIIEIPDSVPDFAMR